MTLGMETVHYVRALRGEEPYSSAMDLLTVADHEEAKAPGITNPFAQVLRKAAKELCIGGDVTEMLARLRALLLQAVEEQYNDMGEPPLVHGDTIKRIAALENRVLKGGFVMIETADEATSIAHLCRMAKFDDLAGRYEAVAALLR